MKRMYITLFLKKKEEGQGPLVEAGRLLGLIRKESKPQNFKFLRN